MKAIVDHPSRGSGPPCFIPCVRLTFRGMILPNLHHNVILDFQPSPPAVSPSGSKSSNAHQTTILCVFAVKLQRRAAQTPPKARSRRDLAIRVPHARQNHPRPRPPPRKHKQTKATRKGTSAARVSTTRGKLFPTGVPPDGGKYLLRPV